MGIFYQKQSLQIPNLCAKLGPTKMAHGLKISVYKLFLQRMWKMWSTFSSTRDIGHGIQPIVFRFRSRTLLLLPDRFGHLLWCKERGLLAQTDAHFLPIGLHHVAERAVGMPSSMFLNVIECSPGLIEIPYFIKKTSSCGKNKVYLQGRLRWHIDTNIIYIYIQMKNIYK